MTPSAPGAPNEADEAGEARRRERLVLLVLAAVQFTSIVDFMIVMPLGPQLMRALRVDPARFGIILSSYTLSACVSGLLASSVMDRFGRKKAFLTLYTGFLLGTLFCGLAQSYYGLLAARIATGAFGGILGGLALAIIGDVFPEQRRGAATGALTSAFALASVVGVPFAIFLGDRYDWHSPFLMLAALGAVVLPAAMKALPALDEHLHAGPSDKHPMVELGHTLSHPNHVRAFALVTTLMLGGFLVISYLSTYLVRNVGVSERGLMWVYIVGGGLTLGAAPLVGKLADRFGKLRVYRIVAPVAAVMMLVVTNLARVPLSVAIGASAILMVANAGRMVVAMTMVTGSVEPRRRGSFMSANSAVQHLSTGLASLIGGQIIVEAADKSLVHFDLVGYLAAAATLASLVLAARLESVAPATQTSPEVSLGAAAEALADASEPLSAAESV